MNQGMEQIRFLPCGDSALTVEFSKEMNEKTNRRIRYLSARIESRHIRGVNESVPAFCSLTVYFDPLVISRKKIQKTVSEILKGYREDACESRRVFLVPVCYDGEYAPDMEDVSALTGLSKQQIIGIHSSADYLIYMLGFLPGFPYLGGMDKRIEAPRLETPRTVIPAGSVGIGGKQTGIYPLASPGGWRLIGRTPVKIYDPERSEPTLYKAGDYIRFFPITAEEFVRMEGSSRIEMKEEPPCRT